MKIGEIIRRERIRNGLSQEDLAKSIGSTKQAIYKYESGIVSNIPMDKVETIANRLGVTPAYLTGWGDSDESFDDSENPHELKLLTAFDKLDIDDQIIVAQAVEDYKKNNSTLAQKEIPGEAMRLTEDEKMLLNLFRQIPEDQQKVFLEMGRVYANSLKKD